MEANNDKICAWLRACSVGRDLLGFYWPVGDRTIIGGIVNAFGDRYEVNDIEMQINGYTFSFSAMHYVTNLIGQGLFVRGEVGPTRFVVDFEGVEFYSMSIMRFVGSRGRRSVRSASPSGGCFEL